MGRTVLFSSMTSADRPPVVFVTGASSGIGRACCERLAAGGWTVVGGSRAATAADRWTSVKLDVRDDQSVSDAVAEVTARHGRIDALVHAAGISIAGAVEDIDLATAQQLFETNYFGTVRMIRAIVPAMRAAGHGRILVIGSIGGLIGLPFLAHYSASKFALVGLVEALRLEIAPFGIDAGIIHPGDIHTNIATNQRVIDGGPASPYSRSAAAAGQGIRRQRRQCATAGSRRSCGRAGAGGASLSASHHRRSATRTSRRCRAQAVAGPHVRMADAKDLRTLAARAGSSLSSGLKGWRRLWYFGLAANAERAGSAGRARQFVRVNCACSSTLTHAR